MGCNPLLQWECLLVVPPGTCVTRWTGLRHAGRAPGDGYTMLLGSGVKGKGGALLVYRSPHLLHGEKTERKKERCVQRRY